MGHEMQNASPSSITKGVHAHILNGDCAHIWRYRSRQANVDQHFPPLTHPECGCKQIYQVKRLTLYIQTFRLVRPEPLNKSPSLAH